MSATVTHSQLHAEFAAEIVARLEKTYPAGRHMSVRARQNIIDRPLNDLEAEFPEDVLRAALNATLNRFPFENVNGPRWFRYTRAIARNIQSRRVQGA